MEAEEEESPVGSPDDLLHEDYEFQRTAEEVKQAKFDLRTARFRRDEERRRVEAERRLHQIREKG